MKENEQKFSQKLIHKLIVCAASLAIVAGVLGGIFLIQEKWAGEEAAQIEAEEEAAKEAAKAAMTEEEIQVLYKEHKKDATETAEVETEATEAEEEADEGESPVDWEGMWEINPDVYAWITIPGTAIDYPILQHATDNSYYLNYNIDGSYGRPGCIYTENFNSKDFTDNNTVIYGHNMKNGTMFADLHKFEDKAFFDEYDKVFIYTPDKQYTYTVFAVYVYDDRHLMYSFDFANEDVYAAFLDNIWNIRDLNANIRSDIEVTSEDEIITLSTCVRNQSDKRLLVHAVLNE